MERESPVILGGPEQCTYALKSTQELVGGLCPRFLLQLVSKQDKGHPHGVCMMIPFTGAYGPLSLWSLARLEILVNGILWFTQAEVVTSQPGVLRMLGGVQGPGAATALRHPPHCGTRNR